MSPSPGDGRISTLSRLLKSWRRCARWRWSRASSPRIVSRASSSSPDACCFVLDFLCIHPFRDGNGRISRLLTLLALYQHGYEVGRYVSLERLVEESRDDYYDVLQRSSDGWHDGKHDLEPWLHFFLGQTRRAYRLLEERAEDLQGTQGTKTAQVTAAISAFSGDFSLAELTGACPEVSRDMVRKVLWGPARWRAWDEAQEPDGARSRGLPDGKSVRESVREDVRESVRARYSSPPASVV